MTDSELLQALYTDMQEMKTDMREMKTDTQAMKADIQATQTDMQAMKADIQETKMRVTGIEISLENETNRNIRLLAENHSNLIDKLNQAIKVSDKTAIYEIQVNILTGKVERLEKEFTELKKVIAFS